MNEFELIDQAKQGFTAWRMLCKDNEIIVQSIAKQYTSDEKCLEELIEAGNHGKLITASKYDVSRGFKFCSYAIWFIRLAIEKVLKSSLRDESGFIKGMNLSDREIQVLDAYLNGDSTSLQELGEQFNLSPERLNQILNKALLKTNLN